MSATNRFDSRPSVLFFGLLIASATPVAATHVDIQVQAINGKIVTGAGTVSDDPGNATITINFQETVFGDGLGSNFRSLNPGFNSLPTGDALLQQSGAEGFAAGTEFEFDLLPMTIGSKSMNLAYWDGTGDIEFGAPPTDTTWALSVREGFGFTDYAADGSDTMVPGTVVGEVSDINRLHQHQRIEVDTVGGGEPEGIYLVSMQMRVAGYETSEPVFLAHSSFNTSSGVRALAEDWVRENYVALTSIPGDFNLNTVVEAADYALWRDGAADITGPAEYDDWVAAFGAGQQAAVAFAAVATAAVPEPNAAALLAASLVGMTLTAARRSGRLV